MLKLLIEKLDDVDESLRSYYVEKGGRFELKVEGVKTQADIDRVTSGLTKERKDHVATQTELKAVKDQLALFDGLKPDEVHAKLGEYDTLKATAGGKPGAAEIEALVKQRVEAEIKQKTTPLERTINQLNTKLGETEKALGDTKTILTTKQIDDAVRGEALAAKADPRAVADFLRLARDDVQLGEDGSVMTKDGLALKDYIADQKAARPWLWPSANGAGAGGQHGTGEGGGPNPFARKTWNMTEQGNVFKTDPGRAEQLAKLAGTTVGGGMPPAPDAK